MVALSIAIGTPYDEATQLHRVRGLIRASNIGVEDPIISVNGINGVAARIGIVLGALLLPACQSESADGVFDGAMVLAMSWQPAFCETATRRPECRSQKPDRYDAEHFSLHGLWPQPGSNVYCGVSESEKATDKARRWRKLAGLGLSDATKKRLWQTMPGARSFLHRHEWVKHGTCYSADAETYYRDSLALMDAVNRSDVQHLFARSRGKRLTHDQVRTAFNKAFGDGVGERVRLSCRRDGNRTLIVELTFGLKGRIGKQPDIGQLALASPPIEPGCPAGIVDPVGLQ